FDLDAARKAERVDRELTVFLTGPQVDPTAVTPAVLAVSGDATRSFRDIADDDLHAPDPVVVSLEKLRHGLRSATAVPDHTGVVVPVRLGGVVDPDLDAALPRAVAVLGRDLEVVDHL